MAPPRWRWRGDRQARGSARSPPPASAPPCSPEAACLAVPSLAPGRWALPAAPLQAAQCSYLVPFRKAIERKGGMEGGKKGGKGERKARGRGKVGEEQSRGEKPGPEPPAKVHY